MTPFIFISFCCALALLYFGYRFQSSESNKRIFDLEGRVNELEESINADIQNLEKDIQQFKL